MSIHSINSIVKNVIRMETLLLNLISIKKTTSQSTNRKIDTKTCRHYNNWYDNNFDDEFINQPLKFTHSKRKIHTEFTCCYLKQIKCTHTLIRSFGRTRTHRYRKGDEEKEEAGDLQRETESRNSNRELFKWKCWANRAPISKSVDW